MCTQDGYPPGQLSGILVESNGIVTARYSNGQSKPAGQIELANFRNVQGLQPLGGNVWARTFARATPSRVRRRSGNLGVLQAGALEDSNIDLTGRAGQHDHRAAHLPGQCADHQDPGPGAADLVNLR
jgi:flagellar hook protein FlgE